MRTSRQEARKTKRGRVQGQRSKRRLHKQNNSMGNATNDDALIPLTPMQMRLLYDSVQHSTPGVHLEQLVCHFDHDHPDPGRMSRAWQRLIERHPVLRCACVWQDTATPHLRPADDIDAPLEVEHPTALSDPAREQWMAQWLSQDRRRGVDLGGAPAWRLSMLVWGPRAFTLVWTFHHLWLDGPSMARLAQEALQDYLAGPASETAAPPIAPTGASSAPTCAAHAIAVSTWRHTPAAVDAARHFFAQMFEGVSLPADRGLADRLPDMDIGTPCAPAAPSGRMAAHATHLPASALARLERLGHATNSSLTTVVYAAWALVLSRWTGHPDAVFGVVRSGRHLLAGARETVGCLINTLPIRVSLRRHLTLADLLSHVRAITVGMRPHEHAALHDIRRWCDLAADANLLDSTVLFEPQPVDRRLSDALAGRARCQLHEQGSSELSLLAYVADGIDLRLEFATELITASQAEQLLTSTRLLLESMAGASPQTPLAALGAHSQAQTDALARWAHPENPVSHASACVATLFDRQARLTPDARAVSFGAECWSFGQLNTQAAQLARWLMGQGVKPGDRVALRLPRGLPFIKAMLAVMKSGAAWVPIDPGYPDEVIQHMVSDCRATLVLSIRSGPPGTRFDNEIALEDVGECPPWPDGTGPAGVWPIDRPAYVIYTSGSTGKPKGVVVGHHALACHAQAAIAHYRLQPRDRVLQFASLSFDISIEEIVPTLLAGAELVLRSESAAETIPDFLQLVQARQITVLNLPTAFWHVLVEQMALAGAALPPCVRLLIVGGEKASRSLLDQWGRQQPRHRWINAYGPTEATISSTCFEWSENSPLPPGPDVPIGRPFGHARAVVLAADGSLAPPGARGELAIGGPALANGYLGLDAITAASFIATAGVLDPRLPQWGLHRLYCTGDEARWDSQGLLHYLGRRDHQVKVRGFRVELRAVEVAIEQFDGVSQCVAQVDQPGQAQARLLAWVLPRPGSRLTEADIGAALARSLPPHARPAIQLVSEWPTTAGGKIDIKRLPAHEPDTAPAPAPQAHAEDVARMAALFARVLHRKSVGPEHSFFDLGGNSLLALSLIGHIEREFHCPVSMGLLKTNPTPAGLLEATSSRAPRQRPQYLVSIQRGAAAVPIYGIHGLGHRERLFRPLAHHLGPDQPFFGLTIGYQNLGEAPLPLPELARLYLKDIAIHQPEGPLVLAGLSHSGYVALELAQQLVRAGRTVRHLVLFDSQGPAGRPEIQGRLARLRIHGQRLRQHGITYLAQRLIHRLSVWGGLASTIGLCLARCMGDQEALELDRPADALFIHQLDRALADYQPAPYEGRVTVFYPLDDPFLDRAAAERTCLGWKACCTGDIDVIAVPGQHTSMLNEPHVTQLAEHLSRLLAPTSMKGTQE